MELIILILSVIQLLLAIIESIITIWIAWKTIKTNNNSKKQNS